ncbi:CBL-interacting serine/threonine-protein kinase 1-like [Cucurbita pepo subsp. pepo]|uniref:CBL-interacting serine/threonine-protein kinase 1-like n=1 Tax=Cucurbita pepo subsp. pepo TaxID=3664 RepID=UPI000C9D2786|nr:CBL-interacting serine/threonine-protein kinase 1-like [Cucurbita pepo subsp. pepo]
MRVGKYELGKTLGEGNFGKVKLAADIRTGRRYAVKILDKTRILRLNFSDQIKREISTLKLLRHPNVVRLYEVLASKTKIYMVLECASGGELFDRIESKGKMDEAEGRRLFQQLIDGLSYCHEKGVYHRDLKLENVLVDDKGNIKISDFGLSALPQNCREDGLLHTTCGSPNYVAPEVLANRGYNGAASDIWSCGVILYVILTACLPFDETNLSLLYKKTLRGDFQIPKWLSAGARKLIGRTLDPNPNTRITVAGIKENEWFKTDYNPASPCYEDEEEGPLDDQEDAISTPDEPSDVENSPKSPSIINAFELIGMSSSLDLSGFFEQEDVSERKIRFTSNHSAKDLLERIEIIATDMGFRVQKKSGKLKVMQEVRCQRSLSNLSFVAEVFEISPLLHVVELKKSFGDSSAYRQLCERLSNDLGTNPELERHNSSSLALNSTC